MKKVPHLVLFHLVHCFSGTKLEHSACDTRTSILWGKIAQVQYLWFYVWNWAVMWGTYMSKYGSFLLLFLLVLSVIVNVYYTVIYTASTCVQFLTLITIFFPCLSTCRYSTHLSMTNFNCSFFCLRNQVIYTHILKEEKIYWNHPFHIHRALGGGVAYQQKYKIYSLSYAILYANTSWALSLHFLTHKLAVHRHNNWPPQTFIYPIKIQWDY